MVNTDVNKYQVGSTFYAKHDPMSWTKTNTIGLLDDEIYEWLYTHTTDYWHRDLVGKCLVFKSKDDAALYTLTWL